MSGASRWLDASTSSNRSPAPPHSTAAHTIAVVDLTTAPSLVRLDEVAIHRAERGEQLILLVCADLERVERGDEIADERIEVGAADPHAPVCALPIGRT